MYDLQSAVGASPCVERWNTCYICPYMEIHLSTHGEMEHLLHLSTHAVTTLDMWIDGTPVTSHHSCGYISRHVDRWNTCYISPLMWSHLSTHGEMEHLLHLSIHVVTSLDMWRDGTPATSHHSCGYISRHVDRWNTCYISPLMWLHLSTCGEMEHLLHLSIHANTVPLSITQ